MTYGLVTCDMLNHYRNGKSYFIDLTRAFNPPVGGTTVNHHTVNQHGAVNVNRTEENSCQCQLEGQAQNLGSRDDIV